jgi:hypothetical protein
VAQVSAHELMSTRLCAGTSCTREISGDEELCSTCQAAADSPKRKPALLSDPLGLELDPNLDVDTWTGLIRRLAAITSATRWWIGDALARGNFPERSKYRIADRELGMETANLKQLDYVARNVERSRRRRDLSFTHHVLVAPLEPDDQERWLARAADEQLTCRELKAELAAAELRAARPGLRIPPSASPSPISRRAVEGEDLEQTRITVTWPSSFAERVRAAARARQVPIAKLMAEAVDAYLAA